LQNESVSLKADKRFAAYDLETLKFECVWFLKVGYFVYIFMICRDTSKKIPKNLVNRKKSARIVII